MNTLSYDERLILIEALYAMEPNYITRKLVERIKRSRVIMLMFMVADKRRVSPMAESLKPPIDLNRLSAEGLEGRPTKIPASQTLAHYAPKRGGVGHVIPTALSGIAATITKLTWKEAEAMGAGIAAKMTDGTSLTAAIQTWADEIAVD